MHFNIASPESYSLEDSVIRQAQEFARSSGSRMAFYRRPEEAVADADAVYTDTWVSMGQEEQSEQRLAAFAGYQVNTRLLRMAKPDAVVLHCLPAHRGQEITDEVADGPQSLIFQESENRLHAQKAILVALLAPDFAGPATG
jgi:ornithine carbamoyltransferase